MSFQDSVQRGLSECSYIIGKALFYSGGIALFLMACVGTMAIDIVLLSYAEKNHDSFLTGFILGSILWGRSPDPLPMLIISPLTSAVAIALSFALGVSGVGLAILTGWAISASVFAIGCGILALSDSLSSSIDYEPAGFGMA